MKLNAILAVAALLGTTALSAQTVQKLDDEKYVLSVQDLSMTVDAGHGGKILSFKLGEQEVLAQNPAAAPQPAQPGEGQPRRRPVPEYDNLPYTAEIKDGPVKVADVTIPALFLQGQVSKYGYRVCKAFTVDPSDLAFVITYSIVNESGETRKIAPWQISRVPNGGFLEFDAKPEGVTPADLMKVTFAEGLATLEVDVADQNRKINVDGKGWLNFRDKGLVLTQRFPDIAQDDAAPGEAEIQVYIDARKSFVEIEAQGPYTELKPGEKLDWTVRWYLAADK